MTIAEFIASASGRRIKCNGGDDAWAGFQDATARDDFERDGYSREAVAAMQTASASLAESERVSTLQRATVGAWDIPSAINGLPVCAVRRTRSPAAPLTVRVHISFHAGTSGAMIARQTARLANALRAEVAKGRAINLVLTETTRIFQAHEGHAQGDTIERTVVVDITRDDQLATALSVQFYRNSLMWANGVNACKTRGHTVEGSINFGDDEARMMRELTAILAA